jgi:hypothetical protein
LTPQLVLLVGHTRNLKTRLFVSRLICVTEGMWNSGHGKAVEIGFSKALSASFKPPADALAKALTAEGITAFSVALQDNDPSPNNIHISVGSKP